MIKISDNFCFIFIRLPVLLGFAVLLQSCDLEPKPLLRVGSAVWPGYEPIYLARSLGSFKNTTVKLVELPSATEVAHAFQNNIIEVAALTLDETISLLQYNPDIRIILVMDSSNGGDALLAKPEITILANIKGKRIGVENTAAGAIILNSALTSANLTPTDIKLIPLTVDEHKDAYANGQIDAIVTYEPVKSHLLSQGAIQLFSSSQIPNRIIDVLITRQNIINQQPEELKHVLVSYFKARNYIQLQPHNASFKMAPRLQVEAAQVMALFQGLKFLSLDENRQLLSSHNPTLQSTAANLADLMFKQKLLTQLVSTDSIIDGSLLPSASDLTK
jgi:NitT/TauT family transport system substrate-binding protein